MSVIKDFREYFDGTRELKQRAASLAAEAERRDAARELQAGVGALSDSGVLAEIREMILGFGATITPANETGLDPAGAYWYRKGLETAVKMLDDYIAAAEDQNA